METKKELKLKTFSSALFNESNRSEQGLTKVGKSILTNKIRFYNNEYLEFMRKYNF